MSVSEGMEVVDKILSLMVDIKPELSLIGPSAGGVSPLQTCWVREERCVHT